MTLALLALLQLAAPAPAPTYAPPPAEQPPPAPPKLPATVWDDAFRSGEGFQNLRWGMTPAEVKAAYPDCKPEGDGLRRDVQVEQLPATERLLFVKERLVGVLVSFDVARALDPADADAAFQPYMAARQGLAANYGPATTSEAPALGSQPSKAIAQALLQGKYTWDVVWDLPHTAIRLKAKGAGQVIRTTIAYGSKEYAPYSKTALDTARVGSERDLAVP